MRYYINTTDSKGNCLCKCSEEILMDSFGHGCSEPAGLVLNIESKSIEVYNGLHEGSFIDTIDLQEVSDDDEIPVCRLTSVAISYCPFCGKKL